MRPVDPSTARTASGGFSMPAPVGGWNARESLAQMPPTDAIYLDNWFPSTTEVKLRQGSMAFATLPVSAAVETLLSCAAKSGSTKLFAVASTGVFDVTAGGAVAASAYAGITTGRIEAVNFNVAGESFLWCCDGTDDCFTYKSSTNAFAVLNAGSTPKLDGITSNTVTNVSIWKNRIILTQKNSLSFWYLPLSSVGGTAVEFPLGGLFTKGGYLVATGNWSLDAGDGPDDRFIALTSEGEVAVYEGTDPSSASTFSIVGVFQVGRPIGKRCLLKLGGDVAILTESGLWPLSKALLSSTIDRRPALTDKIREAFNTYYNSYGSLFGWQPVLYTAGPAVLVNIPVTATVSEQFVMNTLTGAWSRFKNWNARCFAISAGNLYFAQGNTISQAWTGNSDSGTAIVAMGKQAFTYGPMKSRVKHIKLVRPIFRTNKLINAQLALDSDFKDGRITSNVVNRLGDVAKWDTAVWDQSVWASGVVSQTNWRSVSHNPGMAFSLRIRISSLDLDISWVSTDYIGEAGGLFG